MGLWLKLIGGGCVTVVLLVIEKPGPGPQLKITVARPIGNRCISMPRVLIVLTQCPCVIVTWPLAFLSRVRRLRNFRPDPSLGQVLIMVSSCDSVLLSRLRVVVNVVSVVGLPVTLGAVRRVLMCVWDVAILARICLLRVVKVPIAVIRPGIRLVWCRHRPMILD